MNNLIEDFRGIKQELLPTITSIAIPLVQIIGAIVVGLSEKLQFSKTILFPELLNQVNIFVIFTILMLLGWHWYYQTNYFWIREVPDMSNSKRKSQQSRTNEWFKALSITAIVSFMVFLCIAILCAAITITGKEKIILGIFQYIAYSTFLIATGVVIYAWCQEYIQKQKKSEGEEFHRNLLATLEENGWIERRKLRVIKNMPTQDSEQIKGIIGQRVVEMEIDSQYLKITTRFDGKEIYYVENTPRG